MNVQMEFNSLFSVGYMLPVEQITYLPAYSIIDYYFYTMADNFSIFLIIDQSLR